MDRTDEEMLIYLYLSQMGPSNQMAISHKSFKNVPSTDNNLLLLLVFYSCRICFFVQASFND